ncbi:MAG: hypothetical protein ACRDTC_05255 [Pseudonocardiaceae bacterium]
MTTFPGSGPGGTWTRAGRPHPQLSAAALIGYEDFAALEEMLDILSDAEVMAGIQKARNETARGDVIKGIDAVRALRPRR